MSVTIHRMVGEGAVLTLFQRLLNLFHEGSTVTKISAGLLAQVLLSGFHFGLNIALIRTLDAHDFGLFALAFVIAVMGAAISSALVGAPLAIYTSGLTNKAPRAFLETLLSTVNVLLVSCLFFTGLCFATWMDIPLASATAFMGFVAAYTARQYSRAFGFARRRPAVVVQGDLTYTAISIAVLFVTSFVTEGLSLNVVFYALIVGNLAATILELTMLRTGVRLILRWRSLKYYGRLWKEVRWAFIGVTTTTLQAQAHSILISITAGPAAYAPIAAGQLLFGPIRIATQAWGNVMRPELAVAIARHDRQIVTRIFTTSMTLLVPCVIAIGALIALLWQPIETALYASKYGEAPMGWIVAGCCVITLFMSLSVAPSGVLQTFREFRVLAMATIYGALLSLVSVACILLLLRPEYSLLGIMLAEVFVAIFLVRAATRKLRKPW